MPIFLKTKPRRNIRFFFSKYYKNFNIFDKIGLNRNQKVFLINKKHYKHLKKQLSFRREKNLKTQSFLNFNNVIRNYKNFRNILGYPCRGQRTHTNAKTKKKQNINQKK